MNQLIHLNNDKMFVTSLEIAEHFGKKHKNVIQAIEGIECSDDFRGLNFQLTSTQVAQPNGGVRDVPAYEITRDGFVFLCMGFTGAAAAQWKERYINAFNEMEASLRGKPVAYLTDLSLAKQVGELKDDARISAQLMEGMREDIMRLQDHLIASQAARIKLARADAAMRKTQVQRNQTLLVEMLHLEGKTNTQIAQVIGLTNHCVKMRVMRLRKQGRLPAVAQQSLSLH